MMPDAAMIFAAGFGTRMGSLTADRPKALLPVGGVPLLDHTLGLAKDAGIGRRVVNAHYLGEQIVDHLANREEIVCLEKPEILDTGGGLKAALPVLKSQTVFTSNSDAIWSGPNPFSALAKHWMPASMDALLLLVPLDRAVGRQGGGDFDLQNGRLIRSGDFVYTGVQILNTDPVVAHRESVFSLNTVWDTIASRDRLYGAVYPGHWCDVGHPEGIALAEQLLSGSADV